MSEKCEIVPTPEESSNNAQIGEVDKKVNEVSEAVPNDEPTNKEEKQPQIDLQQDPAGWINHQTKAAVHKLNYHILKWVHSIVYKDVEESTKPPVGVGDNGFLTRNQFLDQFRDGTLLIDLANKLSPGFIESSYKGEEAKDKANQKTNIEGFLAFTKEKAGIEQHFELKDLQEKGKAGYQAVLTTLLNIGLAAHEKFDQIALDIDEVVKDSSNAVEPGIITEIINFLKKANPSQIRKSISMPFTHIFGQTSSQTASTSEKATETNPADVTEVNPPSSSLEQKSEESKEKMDEVETKQNDTTK